MKDTLKDTNGTDALGYIRTVGQAPIQLPFHTVVEYLRQAVRGTLADLVDSAYLYGSVARADALPRRSDLDVVLVLTNAPTAQDEGRIEAVRRAIEQQHAVVTKVDFDLGSLGEIQAPENFERWGFWLKHHCRCVSGPDRALAFPLFRPSRAIALAVNGDFRAVLTDYAGRIAAHAHTDPAIPLMRQAARKAIRAANVLRAEDSSYWPESISDHVQQFVTQFPGWSDEIRFLAEQQHQPRADPQDFALRLMRLVAWMEQQC